MKALLVAGLLIVATLASCGGNDTDDPAAPVRAYLEALADGDGDAACDEIAGHEQRDLVAHLGTLLPELEITTCPDAIETLAGQIGPDERPRLKEPELDVDRHSDNHATVTARGVATGQAAEVRQIDGRWLIIGGLTGP